MSEFSNELAKLSLNQVHVESVEKYCLSPSSDTKDFYYKKKKKKKHEKISMSRLVILLKAACLRPESVKHSNHLSCFIVVGAIFIAEHFSIVIEISITYLSGA